MPQSPTQNACFRRDRKGGGSYDLLCQIQSENTKMTWNISLFPFVMIAIFLNVIALQFCK